MDIRTSRVYKRLTPYEAVAIAEGFSDKKRVSSKELIASWQYIYDHDIHNNLQGFFGRTVDRMMKAGIIKGIEY